MRCTRKFQGFEKDVSIKRLRHQMATSYKIFTYWTRSNLTPGLVLGFYSWSAFYKDHVPCGPSIKWQKNVRILNLCLNIHCTYSLTYVPLLYPFFIENKKTRFKIYYYIFGRSTLIVFSNSHSVLAPATFIKLLYKPFYMIKLKLAGYVL